jgi:hypothetical protein
LANGQKVEGIVEGGKLFAREPKRSLIAPREEHGAEQKNFLFLLEKFLVTRANQQMEKKIFLRGMPPSSAAGGRTERLDFFMDF